MCMCIVKTEILKTCIIYNIYIYIYIKQNALAIEYKKNDEKHNIYIYIYILNIIYI